MHQLRYRTKGNETWDFPDGPGVKNLPANAGDTGSIPGPERSHMLWQLSTRTTSTEAHGLEPLLWNEG